MLEAGVRVTLTKPLQVKTGRVLLPGLRGTVIGIDPDRFNHYRDANRQVLFDGESEEHAVWNFVLRELDSLELLAEI